MSEFLASVVEAARKTRTRWRIIPCGGREQAYGAFVDAINHEPEVYNVLLVDSEVPVPTDVTPHALSERDAAAKLPKGIDEGQLQWMVACMEAWFLADPEGLVRHFGNTLDTRKLPRATLAESRTKQQINRALKMATSPTPAGEYRKIRDGAALLATINPVTVRSHCRWCDRLFTVLHTAIDPGSGQAG